MAFFEERLLDCIAYGATGGPTYNTRKVPMRNGRTLRNANWSRAMHRYTASYQNINETDHASVIAAFHVCQGSAHGFRWWDRADYQAAQGTEIGLTDGTTSQVMQLVKPYTFATGELLRPIRKPRAAGFQLSINGVPVASTLDTTTGLVTITGSPPAGGVVTWAGEFDVPVTFESDDLPFAFETRNAAGYYLTADFALIEDFTA